MKRNLVDVTLGLSGNGSGFADGRKYIVMVSLFGRTGSASSFSFLSFFFPR